MIHEFKFSSNHCKEWLSNYWTKKLGEMECQKKTTSCKDSVNTTNNVNAFIQKKSAKIHPEGTKLAKTPKTVQLQRPVSKKKHLFVQTW